MSEKWTGVDVRRFCRTYGDMRAFVDDVIRAKIARCLSPERAILCDDPATSVFFQDAAEWYPCCEQHQIVNRQWTGSTRFTPHVVGIPVFPELAESWFHGLPVALKEITTLGRYPRSDEEEAEAVIINLSMRSL